MHRKFPLHHRTLHQHYIEHNHDVAHNHVNHARQLEFDAWVAPIPVTAEHLGPAPSEANAADAHPDPQLFHINQLLEEIPGL